MSSAGIAQKICLDKYLGASRYVLDENFGWGLSRKLDSNSSKNFECGAFFQKALLLLRRQLLFWACYKNRRLSEFFKVTVGLIWRGKACLLEVFL